MELKDTTGPEIVTQRLNPFALPTETAIRFRLLVAAAIASTCVISAVSFEILRGLLGYPNEHAKRQTLENVLEDLSQRDLSSIESALAQLRNDFYSSLAQLAWITVYVAMLLGLAYIFYRSYPAFVRWRWKLTLLEPAQDESFHGSIRRLMSHASNNSQAAPAIFLSKGSLTDVPNSRVFGSTQRPMLGLTPGVQSEFYKKAEKFRARILHEAAHILNGDLLRAQFSPAIWLAFVLCTVPLLAVLVFLLPEPGEPHRARQIALLILQITATWAIIEAIRRGMIRKREFYADWRVARWDAHAGKALLNYLKQAGYRSFPWQYHPSSAERAAMLENPAGTFKLKQGLAILTGVLTGSMFSWILVMVPLVATTYLSQFSLNFMPVMVAGYVAPESDAAFGAVVLGVFGVPLAIGKSLAIKFAVCFPPIYFVAWVLGAQVQRQAMVDMVEARAGARHYLGLIFPATGLALGFELGLFLMPASAGFFFPHNLSALSMELAVMTVLIASVWVWLSYMRFFAKRILGAHVSKSPPDGKLKWLNVLGACSLTCLIVPVLIARLLVLALNQDNTGGFSPELHTQLFIAWVVIVTVLFVFGILGYAVLWGITALLQRRLNQGRHRPCPACQAPNPGARNPAEVCLSCGGPLIAWLFADRPEIVSEAQCGDTSSAGRTTSETSGVGYVVEHG